MTVNNADLKTHLRRFTHRLQNSGIPIDVSRMVDYQRAVSLVGLSSREDFKQVSRATLISRKEDYETFDSLFDQYWRKQKPEFTTPNRNQTDSSNGAPNNSTNDPFSQDDPENSEAESEENSLYSQVEAIRKKDIAEFSLTDLEKAQRELSRITKLLAYDYSRRRKPAKKGREVHFRKLLRSRLLNADNPAIPYRQRSEKRTRLFVLCDVSGSMESYSRFFLHLLYAMQKNVKRSAVALFSTRTVDVTEPFKRGNTEACLLELSHHVTEWSGGTKIGESLDAFQDLFDQRMSANSGISIVISDGWDSGDPEILNRAIARLRQHSRTIIWMNPLLGDANYQPLCRGIQTVLPYVDHFLPAHNLESLEKAIKKLALLL